jgi:hypothetical protein
MEERRKSCQGTGGSGAVWEVATRTWDKGIETIESDRKNEELTRGAEKEDLRKQTGPGGSESQNIGERRAVWEPVP